MKITGIFLVLAGWSGLVAAPSPNNLTVEGVRAARLKPGGSAEAVLEARVREGFHVQANPATKPNLIATKVDVTSDSDVQVTGSVYPPGKPYKVAGLETPVATFDGRFEVKVALKAAANAKVGKRELEGKIRYQACDDKVCFPPTIAKFKTPVEVTTK